MNASVTARRRNAIPRFLIAALTLGMCVQSGFAQAVSSFSKDGSAVVFELQGGRRMKLVACNEKIIRVVYTAKSTFPPDTSYIVSKQDWPAVTVNVTDDANAVTVATSQVKALVAKADAKITFQTAAGVEITKEVTVKSLTPVTIHGESVYESRIKFDSPSGEGIYGWGQYVNKYPTLSGLALNQRNKTLPFKQENTKITLPIFLSTRGYGVLLNNYSYGEHKPSLDIWMKWATNDAIDYFFMYGPEFDAIIALMRTITGAAPMWPKWAYGYLQSKNRYDTQNATMQAVKRFRNDGIPIDCIVIDYKYWGKYGNGSFSWDEQSWPNVKGMTDSLRTQLKCHSMVSIWPSFDQTATNYNVMKNAGYLLGIRDYLGETYDAFNENAGRKYFELMKAGHIDGAGIDAFWMDASEPESDQWVDGCATALGWSEKVFNIFSLINCKNMYEGHRGVTEQKRVCVLTRSAYPGQQRYGAGSWSGDIQVSWTSLKENIPAGLNFCMGGLPYWCTDIGGYSNGTPTGELMTRWFQYGVFCPVFRTHGRRTDNEPWSWGEPALTNIVKMIKLRYRLMPYIYSLGWKVTSEGYTIMRGLGFDFRSDARVVDLKEQFMFGPAIMVNPISDQGVTSRSVYLPAGTKWYDFWTGAQLNGGADITADAPLDKIPLYVRAGSIIPMGPDITSASEKPADPIELRVYAGANCSFDIYEDEGDNYNYEKGKHATITVTWDEAAQQLRIGARRGEFDGMLTSRTFKVVFVETNKGVGGDLTAAPHTETVYSGGEMVYNKASGTWEGSGISRSPTIAPITGPFQVRGNRAVVTSRSPASRLDIVNASGRIVHTVNLSGPGEHTISIDNLARGAYIARFSAEGSILYSGMLVRQ